MSVFSQKITDSNRLRSICSRTASEKERLVDNFNFPESRFANNRSVTETMRSDSHLLGKVCSTNGASVAFADVFPEMSHKFGPTADNFSTTALVIHVEDLAHVTLDSLKLWEDGGALGTAESVEQTGMLHLPVGTQLFGCQIRVVFIAEGTFFGHDALVENMRQHRLVHHLLTRVTDHFSAIRGGVVSVSEMQ